MAGTIERQRISQTEISEQDWNSLVVAVNGNLDLALATRLFYLLNSHSTHTFDYVVPTLFDYDSIPKEIAQYLEKARNLVASLKEIAHDRETQDDENIWFVAATIAGTMKV